LHRLHNLESNGDGSTNPNPLNGTILVVDDEPANLRLMRAILRGAGYREIHLEEDPRNVPKRLRESPTDLILLDINMPHMNGLELMRRLQGEFETLPPILILTALSDRDLRREALSLGARDFITKPFDQAEALLRIRNAVQAYQLWKGLNDYRETLEDQVKARTHELATSYNAIIDCLGAAAEFRDNETGQHVIRMAETCKELALAVGCDGDFAERLRRTAPMHDVGKIGIPDQVLLKPGPLDPEEWKLMQTHTEIGHRILSRVGSPLMQMAADIALFHHEKWDGTGYPMGLKGEAIPLEARIAAVSDVYDALTSVRPYKDAWPAEKAAVHIRDQAGRHFDPVVVHAFFTILGKIRRLRELHDDPGLAETIAAAAYAMR
jgi:putative two-component system response regulator